MSKIKVIKLLTFDATNTLFKHRGTIGELYAQAALLHGIKTDSDKLETNFRKSYHQFCTDYPNFGQAAGMSSRQWWDQVVKRSFGGYRMPPGIFEKISSGLYDNFKKSIYWDVFPDVVPALKKLSHKGIELGVISNFDERLPEILKELNLQQFFSFIVTSRETAFHKPSNEIFNYALSLANAGPTEAIHVGDNLNLDYNGAKQAGMSACLLLRQPTLAKINYLLENNVQQAEIIDSLHELCDQIPEKKQ